MTDEEIVTVLKFHKLRITLEELIQIMPNIKIDKVKFEDGDIKFHIRSKIGHRIKCYVAIKDLISEEED